MYNVLEKLRSGAELTAKDKKIHEDGLVSVLKQIHDDLDAAVFDAYGWPHDLTDEQILERLVALNAERAAEEKRGIVRWLRPEYQNPAGAGATQAAMIELGDQPAGSDADAAVVHAEKARLWPKHLPQRIAAVRDLVSATPRRERLDRNRRRPRLHRCPKERRRSRPRFPRRPRPPRHLLHRPLPPLAREQVNRRDNPHTGKLRRPEFAVLARPAMTEPGANT